MRRRDAPGQPLGGMAPVLRSASPPQRRIPTHRSWRALLVHSHYFPDRCSGIAVKRSRLVGLPVLAVTWHVRIASRRPRGRARSATRWREYSKRPDVGSMDWSPDHTLRLFCFASLDGNTPRTATRPMPDNAARQLATEPQSLRRTPRKPPRRAASVRSRDPYPHSGYRYLP